LSDEQPHEPETSAPISLSRIAHIWWPLAVSWLLMTVEGPAHSAIVARLPLPEINLAAWGGIVFPISLIIESPVVMLLSASTAYAKDWDAYRRLRRISIALGSIFTCLHIAVAFTPLYDLVARDIIGAPAAILEPGRIGLMIMTPWTWAIAYRRFQQGAMIRFGQTRAVGVGTAVRLASNAFVLATGYLNGRIPGIIVASTAVAVGVVAEAVYAGLRIRPIVRAQIRLAARQPMPFATREFLTFYIPLALTSLITFFVSPVGSAAMSRMPNALGSLAAWPVVNGFIFVMRSPGLAYNEVVVALLDNVGAYPVLRRFATLLGAALTTIMLVVVVTPLSTLWLGSVMALPDDLLALGKLTLLFALGLPLLALLQSWYQGIIVNSRKTRGITESVVLYMGVMVLLFGVGVVAQRVAGLVVAVAGMSIAGMIQVAWLRLRSRPAVLALKAAERAKATT
jgi:hypothetical protein